MHDASNGVQRSAGSENLAANTWRGLAGRILPSNSGPVIAYSRLALAVFALTALYADPSQPHRFSIGAYAILVFYVCYAAGLVFTSKQRSQVGRWALYVHAIDLAAFGLLMYFTDGPTSPFFVFFTFAIISGAILWDWEGAVGTAAILTILYLATGYQEFFQIDGDVNRVIMRTAYLMVVGMMLAYFGAYQQRSRNRLTKLASWPLFSEAPGTLPVLELSLRHAASVLEVKRILVVWDNMTRRDWRVTHWRENGQKAGNWRGTADHTLICVSLQHAAFMARDPLGNTAFVGSEEIRAESPLISKEFVSAFEIGSFSTAVFNTTEFRGRVFILDLQALTPEILSLTEIVAERVGFELEQLSQQEKIASAAAVQATSRIARDMHDSILQDLTATGLELKAKSFCAAADARADLEEAITILSEQQKRIRKFVSALGGGDAVNLETTVTRNILRHIAGALEKSWKCRISVAVKPENLKLPGRVNGWLRHLTSEAVANAVRHGGATEILVSVELGEYLIFEARDNGDGGSNHGSNVKPHALRLRAEEFGGTCKLLIRKSGALLTIKVPRP